MKNPKDTIMKVCSSIYAKTIQLKNDERGDAVNKVFGIFVGVLLLFGIYKVFQPQIDTFIQNKIFGKMNSL